MTELDTMFATQKSLLQTIRLRNPEMTNQEIASSAILHLYSEVTELLDAIGGPWKLHIDATTPTRKSQVAIECVDITKLMLEVALCAGVTPDEFYDAFMLKSAVVGMRQQIEHFQQSYNGEPLVILDLDGVLAAYPEGFFDYLETTRSLAFKPESLEAPDDMWRQLDISTAEYSRAMDEWRETGGLLWLQPLAGAIDFYNELRARGYYVCILTARNKKSLERMEQDTFWWLDHYEFDVDAVFFEQDKARWIKQHYPDVALVVEDNPLEVKRMLDVGLPAQLLERPYTQNGLSYTEIIQKLTKVN